AARILEQELQIRPLGSFECARIDWQDRAVIALSFPRFAVDGVLLVTDHKERLATALDLEELDGKTLETMRLEAGFPAIGIDTDGETLPLELPLESSINFEKGCYMGQETTARMKNFGHANRALIGLKLERPAEPGAAILINDKAIGAVS